MKRFKLLSLFHYIWGGLYLFFGLSWLSVYFQFSEYQNGVRPLICANEPFKGYFCQNWIIFFTIIIHLLIFSFGIINILAGYFYQQSQPNITNWVASCFHLLSVPIGTILGIYGLYHLNNYFQNLQQINQKQQK